MKVTPQNSLPSLDKDFQLLRTPEPPYYAVISTNIQSGDEQESYDVAMQEMLSMVEALPGFLGLEGSSSELDDGRLFKLGVIYWDSLEAIEAWRCDMRHVAVKKQGKALWYDEHNIRVCHVLSHYGSNLTQAKSSELANPVD